MQEENIIDEGAKTEPDISLLEGEMASISAEFPEYRTLDDLPRAVVDKGMKSGRLQTELYRFLYTEERKINLERENALQNSARSVGAMEQGETESGEDVAFRKGLWQD